MPLPEDGTDGAASSTAAIMQPYFLPYIGYFQLMHAVDVFVVYDNIKYTKKGWINRNRLLRNGEASLFSLPLASGPDQLDVRERSIAPDYKPAKLLAQIDGAYRRAPCFGDVFPLLEQILTYPARNLFDYIFHSIDAIRSRLKLDASLVISSSLDAGHELHGQERVLSLCHQLRAGRYVNPPGGRALYDGASFRSEGVELAFLAPRLVPYDQFGADFVPALSILDVLMFNSVDRIREELLPAYEIVRADN